MAAKKEKKEQETAEIDPRFVPVVEAFARDRHALHAHAAALGRCGSPARSRCVRLR
jgi:hypothetical protein